MARPRKPLIGMLGLKPKVPDPRTLRLASYFVAGMLPEPPESVDWGAKVKKWPMLLNDQIGCCAIVCCLHNVQANTSQASKELVPKNKLALDGYIAVGGYRPGDPSTDNGCVMIEVMRYWRNKGFGGHRIKAFAEVDASDGDEVRAAIWLFGGAALGLALPKGIEQFGPKETWRAPEQKYRRGKWAPGSLGGHAVNVIGYDAHDVVCVTWGRVQRMSWNFFRAYTQELYADMADDWISAVSKKAPSGFDSNALLADLQRIAA